MTKLCYETNLEYKYEKILNNLTTCIIPNESNINPLLLVVYYDYLGLTYLKLSGFDNSGKYVVLAKEAFEMASGFVGKVDMSMQIWAGFLYYNLARSCMMLDELDDATKFYKKSILIRERWLKLTAFNYKIRNSLSSEYFLSKMSYLVMCEDKGILSVSEICNEYEKLEIEISAYSDVEYGIDPLTKIRNELSTRKKHLEKSL